MDYQDKFMTISVIIPAYNEGKYIGACLEGIIKNAPENLKEIIVVNNASTDNTAAVASSFAKVRVVNEPQKGLTKARQRGLLEASGDLLAFVDADSMVPENWFEVLNREFNADENLVCLSGPYIYFDIPAWHRWMIKHLYYGMLAKFIYFFTGYMASGGNFVARKDALLKIGGFDTSIVFYGEDTDIARRLHKVGKVKFCNEFFMPTSGRRFSSEGTINTGAKYVANYTSIMFTNKPVMKKYKDIR
jgi:glycosyltransferase involved in cell wall biosynthesis